MESGSYEHFVYGPDRAVLDTVSADLELAGYLVPDAPAVCAYCTENGCAGCRQHWELTAYGPADKAAAPGGRDDILLACLVRGAVYDGGGSLVITYPDLGALDEPGMSLAGELRGYTFPRCPACGQWTVIYSKQESADYCTVCGWMSPPDE